jgi:hypothetical protein
MRKHEIGTLASSLRPVFVTVNWQFLPPAQ